jgi:poly(3-hydroxybutyrate) depolymerase
MLKFLAVCALLILPASGRTQGIEDANLSWENAIVFAADHPEIKTIQQLSSLKTRFPIVIYLHGCAGINKDALLSFCPTAWPVLDEYLIVTLSLNKAMENFL